MGTRVEAESARSIVLQRWGESQRPRTKTQDAFDVHRCVVGRIGGARSIGAVSTELCLTFPTSTNHYTFPLVPQWLIQYGPEIWGLGGGVRGTETLVPDR